MVILCNMCSFQNVILGPVTITNSRGNVKLVGINTGSVGIAIAPRLPHQYKVTTAVLPHQEWITNVIKDHN